MLYIWKMLMFYSSFVCYEMNWHNWSRPWKFQRISQQIRYGSRLNCSITVTAITSVQLHHSREDFHARKREPDANFVSSVCHPQSRQILRTNCRFLSLLPLPWESGREKQRGSETEEKESAWYKAKFESAILIWTATLIGEPN